MIEAAHFKGSSPAHFLSLKGVLRCGSDGVFPYGAVLYVLEVQQSSPWGTILSVEHWKTVEQGNERFRQSMFAKATTVRWNALRLQTPVMKDWKRLVGTFGTSKRCVAYPVIDLSQVKYFTEKK